jgi:hypothetical protein
MDNLTFGEHVKCLFSFEKKNIFMKKCLGVYIYI